MSGDSLKPMLASQTPAKVMRYVVLWDSSIGGVLHRDLYETQGEALVGAMERLESGIGTTRVMVQRVRDVR